MASFYNPYSKYPDFAQGGSDVAYQIMMMKLMQQLMGRGQQQGPQMQGGAMGGAGASPMPPAQQQTPQMGGGIDPKMLMLLQMFLQNRGR